MKGVALDILGGAFILAILYMLVRPSSDGPTLITAITDAGTALVSLATQGG